MPCDAFQNLVHEARITYGFLALGQKGISLDILLHVTSVKVGLSKILPDSRFLIFFAVDILNPSKARK